MDRIYSNCFAVRFASAAFRCIARLGLAAGEQEVKDLFKELIDTENTNDLPCGPE
jgi:hypothetical protein